MNSSGHGADGVLLDVVFAFLGCRGASRFGLVSLLSPLLLLLSVCVEEESEDLDLLEATWRRVALGFSWLSIVVCWVVVGFDDDALLCR